jgi:hypothetical protein
MRNLIQASTNNDILGIRQGRVVVAGRNEVRVEACVQSFFSKHAGMAMRGLKQPYQRPSKPAAAGAARARLAALSLTTGTPINLATTSCQVGSPACLHPENWVRHSANRNG